MQVKIKKIHPDAVVPQYAHPGDSGFDLVAVEDVTIYPQETVLVKTGLIFAVPEGFELQVRPRSGLSLKTPLRVSNSPGTVDSKFRGEVCVIVTNTALHSDFHSLIHRQYFQPARFTAPAVIKKGDRVAQGVIAPVIRAEFQETESLDETERGTGGFGSSDV